MDITNIIQKIAMDTCSDSASEYGNDSRWTQGDGPIVVMSYDMCRVMDKYPRITRAAEEQGIELVNYDEYTVDYNNDKVWRTSPDSYMWQPSVVWTDDGELLTPDDDIIEWIEWAKDDPNRVLTPSMTDLHLLEESGFSFIPDDDTVYENGWHPGQTDDPATLYKQVRETHPQSEVIFWLTETSQFYVRFQVLVRGESKAISNNHWSHDTQVQDVLSYLEDSTDENAAYYKKLTTANPELLRLKWEGSWVDTEAMNVDADFMSWIANEIEDNTNVYWEDGEPYALEM